MGGSRSGLTSRCEAAFAAMALRQRSAAARRGCLGSARAMALAVPLRNPAAPAVVDAAPGVAGRLGSGQGGAPHPAGGGRGGVRRPTGRPSGASSRPKGRSEKYSAAERRSDAGRPGAGTPRPAPRTPRRRPPRATKLAFVLPSRVGRTQGCPFGPPTARCPHRRVSPEWGCVCWIIAEGRSVAEQGFYFNDASRVRAAAGFTGSGEDRSGWSRVVRHTGSGG